MKTAAELTTVIEATTRDLENWIARYDLETTFNQPDRGHARMFTRLNALELGMIAALVRGGAAPSKAVTLAANFVKSARRAWAGSAYRNWLVFAAADLSKGVHTDIVDIDSPLIKDLNATTLSIINVRRLIDGVDKLYAEG